MATEENGRLDPAIVAELYREHAEELQAFLLGVLRNADLAGEALQATFSRAVESGHTAREESRKGWLFRVAFHEAMALRRRGALREKSLQKLAWNCHQQEESPEKRAIRWEQVDRVRSALENLPAEQRTVVRLRIYEDKTFAAIAQELQVPLGTVLTRMRLALRKLQDRLNSKDV